MPALPAMLQPSGPHRPLERAGRARADGGHHEHRLPPAVPRVRRRALRQRDDHEPRAGRAHAREHAPHHAPRVRDAAQHPALRRRPEDRRRGGHDARRRGSRRPHRPQLRMPGAQGHPQGRGSGAAVEARAVPRDRRARRDGGGRHPAHGQDAQGHRLRPPHLPRGGPRRRGRRSRSHRPARAHRRRVLLRHGRLVGDREAQRGRDERAGARQRRHLVGRGRPAHGRRDRMRRRRRRSRLPRPARGCSATSRRPSAGERRSRREPTPRRGRATRSGATPSCSSSSSTTRIARCRDIRKHVAWYFKGYPVGGDLRARARDGGEPRRDRRPARARSTATSRTPAPTPRASAAAPAPRRSRACPTAGSTPASCRRRTAPSSPKRSWTPVAAEAADAALLPGYDDADAERWLPEQHSNRRSDFARDRGRVLHSSALRRLAAKTQVLSPTAGLDFARNRLTHSLEVAQVGRELAVNLGLDPDVVDTACLAHDLGHPPFGHNGERALNDVGRTTSAGSRATRRPCACSPGSSRRCSAPDGPQLRAQPHPRQPRRELQVPVAGGAGRRRPERPQQVRLLRRRQPMSSGGCAPARPSGVRCIEAQVMDLSDDIAYSVHDFEDAIVNGYLDVPALERPGRSRRARRQHVRVDRRRDRPRRADRRLRPPRRPAVLDRLLGRLAPRLRAPQEPDSRS